MNIEQLVVDLSKQGVKLWVEGEQLRVNAPKGVLTLETRDLLAKNKAELIFWLHEKNADTDTDLPLIKAERPQNLPLSFAQERLWLLNQLEPDNPSYNEQAALKLHGKLNVVALEQSLNKITDRHEALRTNFRTINEQPVQVITDSLNLNVAIVDLSELPESEREIACQQLATTEANRPFDLASSPLIRASVVKLTEVEHALVLTIHHIVVDGWSIGVLMHELATIYSAICNNLSPQLPELPIQYADFAIWQRQWLQSEVLQTQLDYWKQLLKNAPTLLELPTDRPRPAIQTFRGEIQYGEFSVELSEAIANFTRQEGATLFMTLFAAYVTLLYRYTDSDDIVVGTPIANRDRLELEGLIGFFVNTLVLRTDLSDNPSFQQLLSRVRQLTLQAYAHPDLPFEELVKALQPQRDLSHTPLFQVMFVLQNAPISEVELAGLTISSLPAQSATAKFDLTLSMQNTATGLVSVWQYNADLFDASTIERMRGHFQTLLEGIVANPQEQISQLPLLTEIEQQQLLLKWNDTGVDYPQDKCIHQLFEEQVERTPDAVAVVYENQHLTYHELNCRANQLAHYLKSLGVKADMLVGICVERSLEMVVGLLGILKAGGAYLPLASDYPSERLRLMLEDAQVSVLLTQQKLFDRLPEHTAQRVCLDADWQLISQLSQDNLIPEIQAANLAYVIYTSGSTGQPKGVLIAHQGLLNLVFWHQRTFKITTLDKTTQLAGTAFDAAVWELWPYLTAGASIYLVKPEILLSPVDLQDWLESKKITISFLPTPMAEQLFSLEWPESTTLRTILTGGDKLHRYPSGLLPFQVVNNYGPTENTVVTTSGLVVSNGRDNNISPPIGRPIANVEIYILDSYLQPVPIGVPGELHIGGAGLAKGYLNRPELTQEKFIPNPFEEAGGRRQEAEGSKLYKTGDLVRYLNDGNIEYLGRIDYQVKIRGFRIELSEIEAVLSQHSDVQLSCVIAREDTPGDKRLVAYVVAHQDCKPAISELRQFLKTKLPEYMVPSAFVILESLPVTPNGKVDRRALPKPDLDTTLLEKYVAPRTPIEEMLALLWAQVLNLELVGIYDNFFELGGHSLLATQLVSRIRNIFKVELPLRELFARSTVAELAQSIGQLQQQNLELSTPPIAQRAENAQLLLSYAQQRLWFLDQFEPNSDLYNIPLALRLVGTLNQVALEQSLHEIIARHEALRTNFVTVNGQPTQIIQTQTNWTVSVVGLKHLSTTEQEIATQQLARQQAIEPFDLANQALVRATLLVLSETEHVLSVCMHHIVSDAWSMGVFFQELAALYNAYSQAQPSLRDATGSLLPRRGTPLAPLPIQYADFALWQRQWLQGGVLQSQLSYWQQQLKDAPALLSLPTDRPRPAVQTFAGAHQEFALSQPLTQGLIQLSQKQGVTLFMTLLAAYDALLYRYTGTEDILVGSPIANRDRSEIEGLIGFFVNTLVLRTNLAGNPSFSELLTRVREMAMEAYTYQNLPFEMLVEALQPQRDLSHTPLFQVMFALQNVPLSGVELAGLSVTPLMPESTSAKFDITLLMQNTADGLVGVWEYNTDLFDAGTIERMTGHFVTLLEGIIANPEQQISQLPLLTEVEQHQLLVEWNDTQVDYPQDLCIYQLFEEQVQRTPDAVAVIFENQQLTYYQLNCRANQLANYLQSLGVSADVLVGICVERSIEMVVGLLGILKAGGAYVPLDPDYPQQRLSFILDDAALPVLLTQQSLLESLPEHTAQVVCLDSDRQLIEQHSRENPLTGSKPENLAYVIYTSGSTGQPKGVQVNHSSVVNFLVSMSHCPGLTDSDTFCAVTTISFDIAALELYLPLIVGAKVVVIGREVARDGARLLLKLQHSSTTVMQATPATWQMLVASGLSTQRLGMKLLCGGEALPPQLAHQLLETGAQVWNLYGPTETTIWSSICQLRNESTQLEARNAIAFGAIAPIGRPIANTQFYILDSHLQPVPVGVAGELHIGGLGLAKGYLNRPQLTQEKFISNPFSTDPHSRLYKTGDLARYLPDSTIEYLVRIDNQVKIRGFRIELGEIEAVLSQHQDVQASCVIAHEDTPGDKRLIAYVVTHLGQTPTVSQLRSFLSNQLTTYMVPHAFVMLESLPLTPNGKVDRLALKAPDSRGELEVSFVAPRNQIEEILAQIWAEVLKVEQVGVHDNFFELGGDSILSLQIINRAKLAELQLTLKQLFAHQTIAELAIVANVASVIQIEQGLVTGTLPLTPIQHWFFEQNLQQPHHFNQSFLLSVPSDLKPELLKQVLQQLLVHHDALRLRFTQTDSTWQQIHSAVTDSVAFSYVDLSALPQNEQKTAIEASATCLQASLNLSENLVQVAFFYLGIDKRARLLIVIHHLVVDGVSWRILLEDLQTAYQQLAHGKAIALPAKTTSFKDWSNKLTKYAQSETLKSEVAYWLNESRAAVPPIPVDYKGANTVEAASTVTVSLNEAQTRALLQDVPKAYNTQINDVLLTALALVLSRWTNSKSVLFNLEGHGREDIIDDVDLSRTIGWFTTIFPVLLELGATENLADALKSVKEQLRAIPNKGIGYGLLRYLSQDAEIAAQLQTLPQAEISFNYLGQFDQLLNTSSWMQLASESTGHSHGLQNNRAHLLDINSVITEERLQINWAYSKNIHQHATIESLAQEFVKTLLGLIAHCSSPESGGYTPSDFSLVKLNQPEIDQLLASLVFKNQSGKTNWRNIEDIYPLSPTQQGMLFESLYAPDSGVYFQQLSLTLSGKLNVTAFEQAWQQVVAEHSILRTAFIWEQLAEPLQVVYRQVDVKLNSHDWQQLSAQDQQQQLELLLHSQRKQGFQLSQPPLIHLSLIQLSADTYQFIWSSHHLLLDGWSMPLVFKDLLYFYQTISQRETLDIQPTQSYRNYIAWLQKQDLAQAEQFWREKLQGFTAPTPLSVDKKQSSNRKKLDSSYSEQQIQLTVQATAAIQSFARKHQLTINNLVQATWALLLCRYSQETDVVFGATVSGRPPSLVGIESMVGLFINTLPVRVQVSDDTQVLTLLKDLQAQQVESEQYSYSSLVEIQGKSEINRGTPLFESIVVFENYPVDEAVRSQPPKASHNYSFSIDKIHAIEQTNYPLTVIAAVGKQLLVKINYDISRFDDATITRLLGHFQILLEGIVTNPEQQISQLPLLTEAEQHQLLVEWNDTQVDYPLDKCLHHLFEEQCLSTPDAIAVEFENQQLTYQQLNSRANQLAHYLKSLGVSADVLVGICVERSIEMVVGLLGILKAGGAYVPIDPNYPQERIRFMLQDCGAKVLLTHSQLKDLSAIAELAADNKETLAQYPSILYLDHDNFANQSTENPSRQSQPDDLAYVIYTSGSTGQPKGVQLLHRGLSNYLHWAKDYYAVAEGQGTPVQSSLSFDATITSLYLPLICGRTTILVREKQELQLLADIVKQNNHLSLVKITPSHLEILNQQIEPDPMPNRVNAFVLGGEALHANQIIPWLTHAPNTRLINEYGPTEAVVGCCVYEATGKRDLAGDLLIGQPIANVRIYILDNQNQLLPVGIPGELCIAGAGLASGYLNRPKLTAEKFIELNLFGKKERIYKTGDLARWLPDGNLEYLGRIDNQIKIRGFRIELGEIEALLNQHDDVQASVVTAREDTPGDKRLVAYVVPHQHTPTINELRQFLKAKLPDYMVPNAFVMLESMPLTPNGKVDRRALPAPDLHSEGTEKYVALRTPIEEILVQIWSQVLKVEQVGIHDNFFELGGHSLLATQVLSRIRDRFKVKLPLHELFNTPTIAELAPSIGKLQQQNSDLTVPRILPRSKR
ncbi:MAG: non-ribosomal peptide synthetase [Nostoc sp.]|uniref:non-ribosomal peptide synthetase n=1 Tax=Nostoc sp. TaxID=1180 RepID=UPI001D9DE47C|nr:non-ribosomal peptide synthetase [Nostoc sp. JL23]MBN3876528.1 amino acid adenylation domain-containing protein [Nostoc sp. JL23]